MVVRDTPPSGHGFPEFLEQQKACRAHDGQQPSPSVKRCGSEERLSPSGGDHREEQAKLGGEAGGDPAVRAGRPGQCESARIPACGKVGNLHHHNDGEARGGVLEIRGSCDSSRSPTCQPPARQRRTASPPAACSMPSRRQARRMSLLSSRRSSRRLGGSRIVSACGGSCPNPRAGSMSAPSSIAKIWTTVRVNGM